MLKNFFKSFLSTLLAVMMVVSVAAIPSSAATLTLSKSSISVTKGFAVTLTASGASSVTWSTGNKSIATVSSKGRVIGKTVGSTYIYAKSGSKTVKCKVTVVPGKITTVSDASLSVGDKTSITVKALGTHAISAKSSDKSIVKATWSGAKFDGNNIKLTLTAIGKGSTTVKIYSKNYSSVYAIVNVTVDSGELDDDDAGSTDDDSVSIVPMADSVSVEAGKTTTLKVYCSVMNGLACQTANYSIASAAVSSSNSNYIPITITGNAAGSTSIKVYSRTNSAKYVTINVTVTGSSIAYYTISDTRPTAGANGDSVISVSINGATKYMLLPANYDTAYVDTVVAQKAGTFNYYTIYTSAPTVRNSSDSVKTFSTTYNNQSVSRFMLVPASYDEVRFNTAIAVYSKTFGYYTIYSTEPTKKLNSDEIRTWTIKESSGNTVNRYMITPYGQSNSSYVQGLIDSDVAKYSSFTYYKVYSTYPNNINYSTDQVFTWTNPSTRTTRYMVIPLKNPDFVKRNDTVREDMGYYCYFNIYSGYPPVYNSYDDIVSINVYSGEKNVSGYMLVDTSLDTATYWSKYYNAQAGDFNYDIQYPYNVK